MSPQSAPPPAHGQNGTPDRRGIGASAMNLLRRGKNNPPPQHHPSSPTPPLMSQRSSQSTTPSSSAPLSSVLKRSDDSCSSKSPSGRAQTRIAFAEGNTTTDMSGSSAESSASSSRHHLRSDIDTNFIRGAPTPYNTMADSQLFAEQTMPDSMNSHGPIDEDGGGPDATRASMGQGTHNTGSSFPYTLSSCASHDYIPQSNRPVPAPPRVTHCPLSTGGAADAAAFAPLEASRTRGSDAHSKRFTSRFRRPKQEYNRDALRLQQLGYDPVLGRDYTFWSSFFISWISIGCLQGTIFAVPGAYRYGGPMMILVAWPISGIMSMALVLILSELASAYPVAGAMTSWSWKLARAGVGGERYWGWAMTAIVLGGHTGNLVFITWQCTNVIKGTMGLKDEHYNLETYQQFLFYLAIVAVVGTIGSRAWSNSHKYWIAAGVFVAGTWLALCIAVAATGVAHRDYSTSQPISTHFINTTGWNLRGYVYLIGWQYCTIATGADASAHMSEETQNPSRNVPNAMTAAIAATYVLTYISTILLLLSVKPEDAELITRQHFPVGHILIKAINFPGALAICIILIIVLCLQVQAQLQAASRFTFAVARDNALPFSDTIKYTNKSKQPVVAHWLVVALWGTCSVLILFNKPELVLSLVTTGASSLSILGYLIPVALYLMSKVDLEQEGRTSWSLRKWSRPVAWVAAFFCVTIIVVQTFPGTKPVRAYNLSWSPVIIAGTLLISFLTWRLYGASHYSGPIRALTKWETGVELDLDSTLQASTGHGRKVDPDDPRSRGGSATSEKDWTVPVAERTMPDLPYTDHSEGGGAVRPPMSQQASLSVGVAAAETVDTMTSPGEWEEFPASDSALAPGHSDSRV